MGVKLLLAGRHAGEGLLSPPDEPIAWLRRVARFFDEVAGEWIEGKTFGLEGAGHPTLSLRLHPAAEAVSVVAAGQARVVVKASTGAVGPGYHRFICALLRQLGETLQISWAERDDSNGVGDSTGYFDTGDVAALEREMFSHLREIASQALKLRRRGSPTVAMPMREGLLFDHAGAFLTPLGPRDDAWLEAVRQDPTRGADVFPWWGPGITPTNRLNRALVRLWIEMVWRPPLLEGERKLFGDVAHQLERAWREDPSLPFPWREWRELLGFLGRGGTLAEEVSRRAGMEPDLARVGYRRGALRVSLPAGWVICVPGSLAEESLPDGTWVARDHRRQVRFVALEGQGGPTLPPAGRALTHRGARVVSEASVRFEASAAKEGSLTALCHSGGKRALCLITSTDHEDRDWALQTWRSIDCAVRA